MKIVIYVGMDVHKDSFSLCSFNHREGFYFAETKIASDVKLVVKYIQSVKEKCINDGYDEVEFKIGYEAGCLGVTLCKDLIEMGYDCKIIAPTSLAKNVTNKLNKNDSRDAKMIATNMAMSTCSYVQLLDEEDYRTRELIRMMSFHKREMTRIKNKIKSFLLRNGYNYETSSNWSTQFVNKLKNLMMTDPYMKEILDEYLNTYDLLNEKIKRIALKIDEYTEKERYKEKVKNISSLKGITKHTALAIISEIGDFTRFDNPKMFASYLGLVPGEHSSGNKVVNGGITKMGNKCIRTILIEACQCIVRYPGKSKSKVLLDRQKDTSPSVISYCDHAIKRIQDRFRSLTQNGLCYNKAITAVARELSCFIWGIMTNNIAIKN